MTRIWNFLGSLRLTVVLLSLTLLLVFFGTLAQVKLGIYTVQKLYFQSFVIFWGPEGAGWKIPVFPGGYLIGAVLFVNLIVSQIQRTSFSVGKLGLWLTHVGIILLILGQLATDMLQVETHMRLTEGESSNYSESYRDNELVLIDTSAPDKDTVISIPEEILAKRQILGPPLLPPNLPFSIQVIQYMPNSRLFQLAQNSGEKPAASQGFGRSLAVRPQPLTSKTDERNLPSAIIELRGSQGSLGTWLVSTWLNDAQEFSHEGKSWQLAFRPRRYYKPYSITLLKFTHEKYPGTEIPKNFASRVLVTNPKTGERRETDIYMNNPLRYGGETYYQGSYDPNDPRVSILQVVRNPGWLTPYVACILAAAGLLIQFMTHLIQFVRERRAA